MELFISEYSFNYDLFKEGIPVRVKGRDEEGDPVDFYGIITNNDGDTLYVVDRYKREQYIPIGEVKGSPYFQADPDYPDKGVEITLLVLPEPEPIPEPEPMPEPEPEPIQADPEEYPDCEEENRHDE